MQVKEIKFRAWDGSRMIHFEDFSIGIAKGKKVKPYVYFLSDTFNGEVKLGKHKIMQWSGLNDADGKEIFEGDIFRYEVPFTQEENPTIYTKEVVFDLGSFNLLDAPLSAFNEHGTVIGNIYENPERLHPKNNRE